MHIFGARDIYPYDAGRVYTPPEATVDAYLAMRQRLGLDRTVVVQPSVYGTDNRCQADAPSVRAASYSSAGMVCSPAR